MPVSLLASRVRALEARQDAVNARNARVEDDKAWETSWTRRALLFAFTYAAVFLYLNAIQIPNAALHAIVPAVGFMLSTLTLPLFKERWLGARRGC